MKRSRNKNLILTLIVTINVIIILAATVTYAWFVQFKKSGSIYFKAGDITYELAPDEIDNTFKTSNSVIVPGEELVKEGEYFDIKNISSITSEFRIKIIVKVKDATYELTPETEEISFSMCKKQENETFEWVYEKKESTNDGYWYYTLDGTNRTMPAKKEGYVIKMIDSIILNGNYFDSSVSLSDVTISILLQGKQKMVDWDTAFENVGTVNVKG